MPVIVVGAGPVGLCSAILLRLWGCQVRIFDKAPAPPTTSRALGIQARTMEALAQFGVADAVETASLPLQSSVMFNERGPIGRYRAYPPEAPYPHTYVAPQTLLDRVLESRLRELGVEVERGRECIDIRHERNDVSAVFANGESIAGDWLIGADGAGSIVRRACGIDFAGDNTGQAFFLADLRLSQVPVADTALTVLGGLGPLMLMRIDADPLHWRLFVDVTDAVSDVDDENSFDPQELLSTRARCLGALRVRETEWRSLYRVKVRLADTYRQGRVLLAGDAAHVFPPFGGQGMNTGILEAHNLAWKLALVERGLAHPDLLDTYEAERRPLAAEVIRKVERTRKSYALRNPLARGLRDIGLRLVTRSRFIQSRISRDLSQIEQSYRGRSSLAAASAGSDGRPATGERAPWYRGSAETASPFPVSAFTLMCFGGVPAALANPRVPLKVMDADAAESGRSRLRNLYGADDGTIILVRPDGHVAFRGRSSRICELERFFDKLHLPLGRD